MVKAERVKKYCLFLQKKKGGEVRMISITFQYFTQKAYFYWHPWKIHLQVKPSKIIADNTLAPKYLSKNMWKHYVLKKTSL